MQNTLARPVHASRDRRLDRHVNFIFRLLHVVRTAGGRRQAPSLLRSLSHECWDRAPAGLAIGLYRRASPI